MEGDGWSVSEVRSVIMGPPRSREWGEAGLVGLWMRGICRKKWCIGSRRWHKVDQKGVLVGGRLKGSVRRRWIKSMCYKR